MRPPTRDNEAEEATCAPCNRGATRRGGCVFVEQIFGVLALYPEVALMGDFNFCASWTEENSRIPGGYTDVWPAVRPDDGFTVDTDLNEMRGREAETSKRLRFDRIFIRSGRCTPLKAKLVGTTSIRGEKPQLYPSDHFGVFTILRWADPLAARH